MVTAAFLPEFALYIYVCVRVFTLGMIYLKDRLSRIVLTCALY